MTVRKLLLSALSMDNSSDTTGRSGDSPQSSTSSSTNNRQTNRLRDPLEKIVSVMVPNSLSRFALIAGLKAVAVHTSVPRVAVLTVILFLGLTGITTRLGAADDDDDDDDDDSWWESLLSSGGDVVGALFDAIVGAINMILAAMMWPLLLTIPFFLYYVSKMLYTPLPEEAPDVSDETSGTSYSDSDFIFSSELDSWYTLLDMHDFFTFVAIQLLLITLILHIGAVALNIGRRTEVGRLLVAYVGGIIGIAIAPHIVAWFYLIVDVLTVAFLPSAGQDTFDLFLTVWVNGTVEGGMTEDQADTFGLSPTIPWGQGGTAAFTSISAIPAALIGYILMVIASITMLWVLFMRLIYLIGFYEASSLVVFAYAMRIGPYSPLTGYIDKLVDKAIGYIICVVPIAIVIRIGFEMTRELTNSLGFAGLMLAPGIIFSSAYFGLKTTKATRGATGKVRSGVLTAAAIAGTAALGGSVAAATKGAMFRGASGAAASGAVTSAQNNLVDEDGNVDLPSISSEDEEDVEEASSGGWASSLLPFGGGDADGDEESTVGGATSEGSGRYTNASRGSNSRDEAVDLEDDELENGLTELEDGGAIVAGEDGSGAMVFEDRGALLEATADSDMGLVDRDENGNLVFKGLDNEEQNSIIGAAQELSEGNIDFDRDGDTLRLNDGTLSSNAIQTLAQNDGLAVTSDVWDADEGDGMVAFTTDDEPPEIGDLGMIDEVFEGEDDAIQAYKSSSTGDIEFRKVGEDGAGEFTDEEETMLKNIIGQAAPDDVEFDDSGTGLSMTSGTLNVGEISDSLVEDEGYAFGVTNDAAGTAGHAEIELPDGSEDAIGPDAAGVLVSNGDEQSAALFADGDTFEEELDRRGGIEISRTDDGGLVFDHKGRDSHDELQEALQFHTSEDLSFGETSDGKLKLTDGTVTQSTLNELQAGDGPAIGFGEDIVEDSGTATFLSPDETTNQVGELVSQLPDLDSNVAKQLQREGASFVDTAGLPESKVEQALPDEATYSSKLGGAVISNPGVSSKFAENLKKRGFNISTSEEGQAVFDLADSIVDAPAEQLAVSVSDIQETAVAAGDGLVEVQPRDRAPTDVVAGVDPRPDRAQFRRLRQQATIRTDNPRAEGILEETVENGAVVDVSGLSDQETAALYDEIKTYGGPLTSANIDDPREALEFAVPEQRVPDVEKALMDNSISFQADQEIADELSTVESAKRHVMVPEGGWLQVSGGEQTPHITGRTELDDNMPAIDVDPDQGSVVFDLSSSPGWSREIAEQFDGELDPTTREKILAGEYTPFVSLDDRGKAREVMQKMAQDQGFTASTRAVKHLNLSDDRVTPGTISQGEVSPYEHSGRSKPSIRSAFSAVDYEVGPDDSRGAFVFGGKDEPGVDLDPDYTITSSSVSIRRGDGRKLYAETAASDEGVLREQLGQDIISGDIEQKELDGTEYARAEIEGHDPGTIREVLARAQTSDSEIRVDEGLVSGTAMDPEDLVPNLNIPEGHELVHRVQQDRVGITVSETGNSDVTITGGEDGFDIDARSADPEVRAQIRDELMKANDKITFDEQGVFSVEDPSPVLEAPDDMKDRIETIGIDRDVLEDIY